jgi:hypothetical protein
MPAILSTSAAVQQHHDHGLNNGSNQRVHGGGVPVMRNHTNSIVSTCIFSFNSNLLDLSGA